MLKGKGYRAVHWGLFCTLCFCFLFFTLTVGGCSSLSIGFWGEQNQNRPVAVQTPVAVQAKEYSSHLVILFVPGFNLSDVDNWLDGLPEKVKGHLQLAGMSMRTSGSLNLLNNMFTLASGQFEAAPSRWNAYQLSGGRIVHPVGQLKSLEHKRGKLGSLGGENHWGKVGEHLARNEIYTFALGNSDTLSSVTRFAPLLIMDKKGEARGAVDGEIVTRTPYLPGGYRTNWAMLTDQLEQVWQNHSTSLIVVELGDLWRIEQAYAQQGSYTMKHIYRKLWLDEWKDWFAQITTYLADDGKPVTLWVVSPMVSQEAKRKGQILAPFITWSSVQKGGILSSSTTRQYGLVTNLDFLPTLFDFFHLSPQEHLYGQVIRLVESGGQLGATSSSDFKPFFDHLNYLFAIYGTRRLVISVYLVVMIILLIGTAVYWWFSKQCWGARIVQVLIGTMLISPIYFLWLTPLIKVLSPLIWIGLFFTCSFFTSFLIYRLVHPVWFLTLIGLANSVVILLDLWRGSPWMKRSFLGYDPLIGARFYGLGNEYAGILLGSSLLAVTGLCVYLNRRGIQFKKGNKIMLVALVSLFYVIIIYSMASPQLGTNAGATIAALFTYALSLFLLFRLRISWTILVPLFGLVSVYVAYLVHLHLTGEQTHIGLFIEAIRTGDLEWVAEILYRKLAMNWRLIKVSLWGKLFTTALVVMGLIYLRLYRDPFHKRKFGQQDVWMTGFKVMIVGALSILLVNDSGVVAAATTVIYMTFPFIFLRFDRHLLKTAPSSKGLA